jgi:hypothetical protein
MIGIFNDSYPPIMDGVAVADVALYLAKQQKIPVVATFHSKYKDDFE